MSLEECSAFLPEVLERATCFYGVVECSAFLPEVLERATCFYRAVSHLFLWCCEL